jgi:hypothetical protein
VKVHKLRDGDIAVSPDWNNGKPVRISRAGPLVRWQDVNAHGPAHQVRPGDTTEVTVKARRGGR